MATTLDFLELVKDGSLTIRPKTLATMDFALMSRHNGVLRPLS